MHVTLTIREQWLVTIPIISTLNLEKRKEKKITSSD
ncbi:unnamed protein product, partial [Nezara viridula]